MSNTNMQLTDQINIRVDHELKINSEFILNKMGIKTADAIRMFLTQVCLTKSFPLNVKLPNRVTKNAIKAGEIGKVTKITSEEFDDLLGI